MLHDEKREMIRGVRISMGGRDWIVPPLTLGQLRRLVPKLNELSAIDGVLEAAQIDAVVDIVAGALSRNYPEVTSAAVAEMIDLGNATAVVAAVLTGSGLKREAVGEAAAVASSAGETSTDFSLPPADIPIARSMS